MVHVARHVRHGQQWRFPQCRYLGLHAFPGCQGAAGIAGPPHGLGEDGVGPLFPGPHDHIVGLGHADAELIHVDRLHIIAVGLDHRHFQAGYTDIEVGHGGGIDKPQADSLARLEQAGPVLGGPLAVDQPGKALDVLDVRFHHPHLTPHQAVFQGGHEAVVGRFPEEISHRLLLPVVVIRRGLQVAHDTVTGMGVLVGKLDDVFPVVTEGLTVLGLDHNGAVGAVRLLEAGVAVEPVSAGLDDREAVGKGFSRFDTRITDTRHTVLLERQNEPVPVHGRHFIQVVGHMDGDVLAFLESKHRTRRFAIVSDAFLDEITGVDGYPINAQVVFAAPTDGRQTQGKNPNQMA